MINNIKSNSEPINEIGPMQNNINELDDSKDALNVLGGKIVGVREFFLPDSDYKRNIVLVEKIRRTPNKYPRKAGKPKKDPL